MRLVVRLVSSVLPVAVRNELQKAMDAAALAGAGNLGFNASVFPTARQAAQTYAGLNPYSGGTISLNQNTANAANGDIATTNYARDYEGTVVGEEAVDGHRSKTLRWMEHEDRDVACEERRKGR